MLFCQYTSAFEETLHEKGCIKCGIHVYFKSYVFTQGHRENHMKLLWRFLQDSLASIPMLSDFVKTKELKTQENDDKLDQIEIYRYKKKIQSF